MGDGLPYIDIILLAMIAGFIALRLRSVLGKRTGDEETRAEKRRTTLAERGAPGGADAGEPGIGIHPEPVRPQEDSRAVGVEPDSPLGKTLARIKVADRNFDPVTFLDGAQAAYRMIVEAFATGDRDQLRGLLSPEIYDDFESAITDREAKKQTMETKVVDIEETKIEDAGLDDKTAEITVKFVAHCVSLVRDEDGEVISGNVSDAEKVVDVWTFAHDTSSRDPNWLLVATSREE